MDACLVSLVGDGDLDAVRRHLDSIRRTQGQAAVVSEITTCEHEGRNAKSALHRAALRGRAEIISVFLREEAPVDVLDEQGNTPLHLATDLGRARAVHCLLQARACVQTRNCFGRSAKEMAVTNSWDEQSIADGKALIRRMFEEEQVPLDNLPAEPPAAPHPLPEKVCSLEHVEPEISLRADKPASSREDLEAASSWTRVFACLQALVKQADLGSVKRWLRCKSQQLPLPGETAESALFAAVGSCEFSETGEDTRVAQSALHLAALHGHTDILMLLLETRINPNVTNDQGSTPLHLAVDLDRAESAQLLLKFRANPCLRNNFGRTPYGMRDGRGRLPVPPSAADRMVTIFFDASKHLSDTECSICREDFQQGDQLRVLPCLHKYHAFCIDEWLARSVARNCPSCLHCIDNVSSQEDDIELISL
mmetsp:Transcript_61850/g.144865  ORF Transcript_61850/g.144865 Transcript_61850/m.144865 type:complete len:423 (-) Transcript_61850:112-1380(-)